MRPPWQSLYLISAGSLLCAFAVALGAFGAHVFAPTFTQLELDTYRTAVQYQFMHAIGMILAGVLARWLERSSLCAAAGFAFLIGVFLFSFSLYALVLFDLKWLGAIAPAGGLAFMVGWSLLMWACYSGWSGNSGR
jgi:uncharacterized membrane protein YgdD (TMEM256/DUF423 family)